MKNMILKEAKSHIQGHTDQLLVSGDPLGASQASALQSIHYLSPNAAVWYLVLAW